VILEEVDRLAATTTQFLKFSRPASGGSDATDIVTVIEGVIHVLSHLAKQHNIRVDTTFANDVPSIACPDDILRQIFFNLVLNAIEATPPHGQVRICVDHNTDWLVTAISDNGVGISSDRTKQIFDPFVTSKTTGTGLGLYVVRRNIEELGGTIECQSEPARGTCFTIKLPLDKLRCEHEQQAPHK
jgi:signal transduction histidine kinase